jgi:hypothetical protein
LDDPRCEFDVSHDLYGPSPSHQAVFYNRVALMIKITSFCGGFRHLSSPSPRSVESPGFHWSTQSAHLFGHYFK